MPLQAVNGATMTCIFGAMPSTLIITPERIMLAGGMPAGNITDCIPMKNIPPFGMCISPANPAFVSATAAAFGVPTPVPCTPVITGTWMPGAVKMLHMGAPALHQACTCSCALGGVISITNPGQIKLMVN
jgi:hypothetical protein